MTFWIFNVQADSILGLTKCSEITPKAKRLLAGSYLIYLMFALTVFYFKRTFKQAQGKIISTSIGIGLLTILVFTVFVIAILIRVRIYHNNQILPDSPLRRNSQRRTGLEIRQMMKDLKSKNTDINSPRLTYPLKRSMSLRPYSGSFLACTLFCTIICLIHSYLLYFSFAGNIQLIHNFPMHIVISVYIISLMPLNAFIALLIINFIANLIFSRVFFINYFESHLQQNQTPKIYIFIWRLLINVAELFLVSLNFALLFSSIIGFIFIGDLASKILFYIYISMIACFFYTNLLLSQYSSLLNRKLIFEKISKLKINVI